MMKNDSSIMNSDSPRNWLAIDYSIRGSRLIGYHWIEFMWLIELGQKCVDVVLGHASAGELGTIEKVLVRDVFQ